MYIYIYKTPFRGPPFFGKDIIAKYAELQANTLATMLETPRAASRCNIDHINCFAQSAYIMNICI